MFKALLLFCSILFFSVSLLANTPDHYISKARELSASGDLGGAAVSYQKALKLDQHHAIARRELRNILIESKNQDPESEFSEAEWALLEAKMVSENNKNMNTEDEEILESF